MSEQEKKDEKDLGASLLPGDALAPLSSTETLPNIAPWEKNDRVTRGLEWVEFYLRCLLIPFTGVGAEYTVNSLKQDYQRLRAGKATYWYNRKWDAK